MEPPKATPLQIPSEDDVPLFDPSGLSASLSADDWHNSFDLNSVAAIRLGIGSPPSQDGSGSLSASFANLGRSQPHSRNTTNSDTVATSQPPQPSSASHASSHDVALEADRLPTLADDDASRRGRRRRSSAANEDTHPSSSSGGVRPAALPQKDTSVGSKVRMWWERSAAGTPEVDGSDSSIVERAPSVLPSLRTDTNTLAPGSPMDASKSHDTPSDTVRSPAADFLSAFSSLNSVVQPAASYDNRSLSYSPPRPGHRSLSASLMRDETRNGSAAAPSFGSLRGLGSAAAQLYDSQLTTAPKPPPRNDDEGARVGPAGRYLLGKTIGVGGFSTVREAWDLEAQGPIDPAAPIVDGQQKGRRVAVKIVYHHGTHDRQTRDQLDEHHQPQRDRHSQELRIWKSLPIHQHLLPLLHHESVTLDPAGPDLHRGGADATAELLIMPFCDQGNLLDFVRSEGGANGVVFPTPNGGLPLASPEQRSASSSWVAPGSARSSILLSRSTSLRTSKEEPSRRQSGLRTGSGFIVARNSQLRTIPAGQEASSVASSPVSAAGSVSSGSRLIRRTNSQLARSQGIPIDAARETMRQLASALSTLHNKSHVLHGDLKLENVLGQDQTSWKKRQRTSTGTGGSNRDAHSRQNSGGLADSIDSLATNSISSKQTLDMTDVVMPCWRIADFGLAQVMDPAHSKAGMPGAPALIRALKQEASNAGTSGSTTRKKGFSSGRGGSLAYTAPEFLRAQGTPGTSSPTALESADGHSELPPESPFAADMWALGCILYALLSGKLPFTDSFEPRLQMKIAKAQWELPPRLRRRAERLANSSTSTLTSQVSQANRSHATNRSNSIGQADAADRFAFSQQRRSASGLPRGLSSFASTDLSASLPSLLPRERQMTEPATSALPRHAAVVHTDQVVGSAPGRADHLESESFEINPAAKARADVEEDPESDEDSDMDPSWDGLSWDRAAARQVLRGLLEPDPKRRWTVDQLCSSAWIRREGTEPTAPPSPFQARPLLGDPLATGVTHTGFMSTATKADSFTPVSGAAPISDVDDADKATADSHHSQRNERGRRSSSLARTRPVQLALDSPASASSSAQSPALSLDEEGNAKRRSRSTSRISIQYRDSSRNRSTDVSGSSTPNRERDHGWTHPHLSSSFNSLSHLWLHSAVKERCDSPAESERRGRVPRSRMADLDENTTWNGEDGSSSCSRAGSREASSLHRAGPIAIRGRSQSRSRSRHSRESASPERFGQRSLSRPRTNYSLSHDAGTNTGILYGRSAEPQSVLAPIVAERTQVQRSSTARSRSRAPDALAQILDRQRSRSRSRVRGSVEAVRTDGVSSRSGPLLHPNNSNSNVSVSTGGEETSETDQEARGRARDRR